MKRLVYQRPDGGVSIVIPNERLGKTTAEYKARAEQANPALKTYVYIGEFEPADLPADREFRNQWRPNGANIHVDPALETEERWRRIRVLRDQLLIESDQLILRAQEVDPTKVTALRTYRQELRDITNQSDPKNIVWPVKP